jgi:hypothetical protein
MTTNEEKLLEQDGAEGAEGDGENQQEPFEIDVLAGMASAAFRQVRDPEMARWFEYEIERPADFLTPEGQSALTKLQEVSPFGAAVAADIVPLVEAERTSRDEQEKARLQDERDQLEQDVAEELARERAKSAEASERARIKQEIKERERAADLAANPTDLETAHAEALADEALKLTEAFRRGDPDVDLETAGEAAERAIDALRSVEIGSKGRPIHIDTNEFLETVNRELKEMKNG